MGSFMGRGNQDIQLVKFLYYKLPTNGKKLPPPSHSVRGLNHQLQRWDASVLPLYNHGPLELVKGLQCKTVQIQPLPAHTSA